MLRLCLALSIIAFSTSLSFAQISLLKAGAVVKPSTVLKSQAALKSSQATQLSPLLTANRIKRQPDLAVTYLGNGVVGPSHDPRSAYVIGRVKNIGTASYPAGVVYEFRLGGMMLKKGVLPVVAPGQEITLTHNFPGLKPAGAVSLQIFSKDKPANNSKTIIPR